MILLIKLFMTPKINSRSLSLTRCYRTRTTADKREIKDCPKFAYRRTSFIRKTSGCVKTHVWMKNKPYTAFKSENKVKISLNFGFSHSLTLSEIPNPTLGGERHERISD